jgi:ligand-binding sensor domain-containing protein
LTQASARDAILHATTQMTRLFRRAVRLASLLAPLALAAPLPVHGELLPVRAWSTLDGLPHDRVKRIREDDLGFLWFCTTEGLSRFDGREFVSYGIADGLPVPSTNDLLTASGGAWVATNGGGVAFFDPAAPRPLFRPVAVGVDGGSRVNVLHLDRMGNLWAGTDGGLFRMDRGRTWRGDAASERVPLAVPGQPEESVMVWAFLDSDAGLLVGTRFGLALVGGFASDGRGRLWATTFGKGLLRIDDPGAEEPTAILYGPSQGVQAFHLSRLVVDGEKRIVFATSRELMRLDPATGVVSEVRTAHGLVSTEATGALRDRKGKLWIASWNGLARLDEGPAPKSRPPAVRLSAIQVSGEARPVSGLGAEALDLGELPHSAYVSLDFFGLGRAGEPLPYEHLLEGLDRGWSERRKDRAVHFDPLAAGRYRLLVRAVAPGETSAARRRSPSSSCLRSGAGGGS